MVFMARRFKRFLVSAASVPNHKGCKAKPSFAILLSEKLSLSDRSNGDLILIECDIVTVFVIFCPRLLRYGVVD